MIFKECLEDYLNYLAAKGFAANTIQRHRIYGRRFLIKMNEYGIMDIRAIAPSNIQDYLSYLTNDYRSFKGERLAYRTLYSHFVAINSLFDWLVKTDQILLNPCESVPIPKTGPALKLPVVLTEAETIKILESCTPNTPNGIRNRAILELLYSTGIRRAELVNLNVNDFLPEKEELVIVKGKGRKGRIVPVGEYALAYTSAYLKLVRPWMVTSAEETALFVSKEGTRLHLSALNFLIGRIARQTGIPKKITPHTFRHTMATHLLRNQADLRHIQAILGHGSLLSTEVYTHLTTDDLRQAIKKAHPHGQRKAKELTPEAED